MDDRALGFALIGIAIIFVLGVAFAVTTRVGRAATAAPAPPSGVHMPAPSWLPVLMSVAALLIGAGLVFKPDDLVANPWIAIPGLLLLVASIVAWVRDAGHEWRDAEHGSHDDAKAH
jgi:hypothetical protein